MTLVQGMSTDPGMSAAVGPNRGVSANMAAKPGRGFHGMIPNQKLQKMARPYIMSAKNGHSKMKYNKAPQSVLYQTMNNSTEHTNPPN